MKCGKFVAEFINYAKTRVKITYSKIKEWCGNRIDSINAFFTAAIETCKIKWELIKEWCNGQLENIKDVLNKIY
jgi:nucleosome binding factor SPN SPT16 subunit